MASFSRSFRGFSRVTRQTCTFRSSVVGSHAHVGNARLHVCRPYGLPLEINFARQAQRRMADTIPLSAACSVLLGGLPQRAAGITATSGGSSSDLTESSGNDDEGLVIYPNEGDEDL